MTTDKTIILFSEIIHILLMWLVYTLVYRKTGRIIINYHDYHQHLPDFLCDFTNEFIITAFRNKPSTPDPVFGFNFLLSNSFAQYIYVIKLIPSLEFNDLKEKYLYIFKISFSN